MRLRIQASVGPLEFTALMACLMSLPALSTDIMIPGLLAMGRDLGVAHANAVQLIVATVFVGVVPGQLLFGPLADSFGRRPVLQAGIAIFLLGSLITTFAPTFSWLLAGRAIQGLGLAAPRTLTLAIVRDRYEGVQMAKVISNIMSVFGCIPMVAPIIGQLILFEFSWRAIFAFIFLFGAMVCLWFTIRQEETLSKEARTSLSFKKLAESFVTVGRNRVVILYAIGTGSVFAGFVVYMSTASQIYQQIYDTGRAFGFLFALSGIAMIVAAQLNGRWVERLGMQRICLLALLTVLIASVGFAAWMWLSGGRPSLLSVIIYLVLIMFADGALYGNLNALAMEPMKKNAGMGAMVVSTVAMVVSVPVGILFAQMLTDTVLPLVVAFAILASVTLLIMYLAESGRTRSVQQPANPA
jgi:MFS transporter, DHA1 family, multidrug resistance protein